MGTIGIFVLAQVVVVILFGVILGFSGKEADIDAWLASTTGQFAAIAASAAATAGLLWLFLRWRRTGFRALGLARLPSGRDAAYIALGFLGYFVLLIGVSVVAAQLGLDTQKEQEIGFEQAKSGGGLWLVFASLVIIPPIIEELVFRGFLFGGLRTKLNFAWATAITSVLFAIPHLFATSDGLLWIAAIDTLLLSLVLCYAREKTGALWAPIGIHAVKNSLAFLFVFVV